MSGLRLRSKSRSAKLVSKFLHFRRGPQRHPFGIRDRDTRKRRSGGRDSGTRRFGSPEGNVTGRQQKMCEIPARHAVDGAFDAAPALIESVRAGTIVTTEGPVSAMGRLDCKTPSMIALAGLARDGDLFVTISEAEAERAVERLAAQGIATTRSGAAGVAALIAGLPDMPHDARVLAILSEGPEIG